MKEKTAEVVCIATQNTNFACSNICKKRGSCAYCLVMAEELLKNGVTIISQPTKTEEVSL